MPTAKKSMRVWGAVVLASVVLASVALASCGGSSKEKVVPPPAPRRSGDLSIQVLQSEHGQQYRYKEVGRRITVTAPRTNLPIARGGLGDLGKNDIGEAFWSGHQVMRSDQQACATWVTMPDGSTQKAAQRIFHDPSQVSFPGIALRVRPPVRAGAAARALLVVPSSLKGAAWAFAVAPVVADIAGTRALPTLGLFSGADFAQALGTMKGDVDSAEFVTTLKPPPWHVCARAVGTKISIMVWTGGEKKPLWSDPVHVKSVVLTADWVYQGYAGGYIDRLSPGRTAIFDDLKVTSPY